MTEMTQAGAFNAHPADLIAAITGSERVTLGAFGAPPMPPSWLRPSMRFVGVNESPSAAIQFVQERHRALFYVRLLIGMCLLAAGLSAGIWLSTYLTPRAPATLVDRVGAWSVVSIESDAIIIQSAKVRTAIKTGTRLPNGELLVATRPPQRAYITDKATVMVNADPRLVDAPGSSK